MADRPILFSAPMVRALLAGTKTQTRRMLPKKLRDAYVANDNRPSDKTGLLPGMRYWNVSGVIGGRIMLEPDFLRLLPYAVGDRLWVRERLQRATTDQDVPFVSYFADGSKPWCIAAGWHWKNDALPSIHMPKTHSRLTLHVTDVSVERLQDISEADALAEGISYDPPHVFTVMDDQHQKAYAGDTAKDCYADLWDGINGAGSWDKNPWVAAYTFTVERTNIDQARAAA